MRSVILQDWGWPAHRRATQNRQTSPSLPAMLEAAAMCATTLAVEAKSYLRITFTIR
ncbi:hypothetical protein [Methylobacterium nigriterrae]|uniref:hypothetical protein n=1 Tax=Methylobacterium nigriterrae TaxID=3127512 RepID=UPI00301338AB